MLRKLFLISLIALMPIQSWAVLDMSFKHQAVEAQAAIPGAEARSQASSAPSSHPCHQESLANISGDIGESNHAENAGCNSCTLCMAFGLPFFFSPNLAQGDFTQRFFVSLETFQSQDLASLNKPPIL